MMKNNKGFTLIELIIVTVVLGILAAVAVPRFMGAVSESEGAAEAATIAALQSAVETYANQQYLETGRYSYPSNPFDYIEVDGYEPGVSDGENLKDGGWAFHPSGDDAYSIVHKRNDDNLYEWSYSSSDLTDLDGDDRGANVGLAPENPNQTGSGHTVHNAKRHRSTNDVESGGSGFGGGSDNDDSDDNGYDYDDYHSNYGDYDDFIEYCMDQWNETERDCAYMWDYYGYGN